MVCLDSQRYCEQAYEYDASVTAQAVLHLPAIVQPALLCLLYFACPHTGCFATSYSLTNQLVPAPIQSL